MDLQGPLVYQVWSQDQLHELLKVLVEVINKYYTWGSTFREESWKLVGEHMDRKRPHVSVDRLKAKLRQLRRKYKLFSSLLARRGVRWDRRNNVVHAPEEVWIAYVMEHPLGDHFRFKGIPPRLFDTMRDIFESGVAIDLEHC